MLTLTTAMAVTSTSVICMRAYHLARESMFDLNHYVVSSFESMLFNYCTLFDHSEM